MNTSTSQSTLPDCACGNTYLAIQTDVYKDGREFIYCDCCGAMATRPLWVAAHPTAKPAETPALSMSMFASRSDYDEAMRSQVVLITDDDRRKNEDLRKRLDEMPTATQPVQPTPLTGDEMSDVTEYLEAWGCLCHSGVRRLIALGNASITQPVLPTKAAL